MAHRGVVPEAETELLGAIVDFRIWMESRPNFKGKLIAYRSGQ